MKIRCGKCNTEWTIEQDKKQCPFCGFSKQDVLENNKLPEGKKVLKG